MPITRPIEINAAMTSPPGTLDSIRGRKKNDAIVTAAMIRRTAHETPYPLSSSIPLRRNADRARERKD